MHVEQKVEFGCFGQITLNIQRALLRVQASGQVFRQNGVDPLTGQAWFRVRCQGMVIRNKKITIVAGLHLHKLTEGPQVIAQMQAAC